MRDLYQILQVDPRADPEVLEAAYWRLARKYHPDVSTAPDAEARIRELNDAYATLSDPIGRARYDRQRIEDSPVGPHAVAPRAPARRRRTVPSPGGRERSVESLPRVGIAAVPRSVSRPRPAGRAFPVAIRARHRIVIIGLVGAIVVTALLAAVTASLFVPTEQAVTEEGTGRGVVLVPRSRVVDPTPTIRSAVPGRTPASWPPFIYVLVPAPGATPTVEEVPGPAPVG